MAIGIIKSLSFPGADLSGTDFLQDRDRLFQPKLPFSMNIMSTKYAYDSEDNCGDNQKYQEV